MSLTQTDDVTFATQPELVSRDETRNHQERLFRKMISYVYENNAFYRKRFNEAGITPQEIRGLDDINCVPMISKTEFRETYPLGMCCVPREIIREIHMSSGSTGVPVVMPYTKDDVKQWADCMARCYRMSGAAPGDPVQITPSFGLFNGGFGMYHGAREAELFVIPTGAGNTERQIRLARDFKTRIFTAVVSYGIRIIEIMNNMGIELPDLKIGIFGAESFTDAMKKQIRNGLGVEPFDIYGMTETGGVGTLGMDCRAHQGIHVWEDHYYIEVADVTTHKPVPDGHLGELIATSLTRQALPVIRFRTGDLTRIVSREKCSCGRTHTRIETISGRADDMLIVKGINFFPSQVEQVLLEIPGVHPHYQIIIEDVEGVKDVRINVEAEPDVTGYMVEKHLKERLGFSPKGDVYKPGELARQDGKAQRVFYEKKTK
ncbi:MAG: phenylacetate--CoA ligase [Planctomycetaceae bacterium]|jgi:phenylacetate-CoA ligase|nr:phenylacetate--CoA ligase [Planctomycetaceae bacterium]